MTGQNIVIFLIIVLSFTLIGKLIENKTKVPLPVSLIIMSSLLMPFLHIVNMDFSVLMTVLLPLLLISDSLHIDLNKLKKNAIFVFYTAGIAIIISIIFGYLILNNIFKYDLAYYVTILSIVMATDAVSVTTIFEKFKIPEKTKFIIESESLFNDATSLILFSLIALPMITNKSTDFINLMGDGTMIILLSIIIGIFIGMISILVFKYFHDPVDEFIIIPLTAYVAYIFADLLEVSGILSVIISIIILKHFISKNLEIHYNNNLEFSRTTLNKRIHEENLTTIEKLEENENIIFVISLVAISVLFVSLGSVISFKEIINNYKEIFIIFIVLTFVRFIVLTPMVITKKINMKDISTMTLAGIKGGVSILMVHMIPDTYIYKHHIEIIVYGLVLTTILINSTLLLLLIPKLYKNE